MPRERRQGGVGMSTNGADQQQVNVVEKSQPQYLLAPRRGSIAARAGLRPMSARDMQGLLSGLTNVEVVRVVKPRSPLAVMSVTSDEAADIFVLRMEPERFEMLRSSAPPHVILESDAYLGYGPAPGRPSRFTPLWSTAGMSSVTVRLRILGMGDQPVANASVTVATDGFPAEGKTDVGGEVALQLTMAAGHGPRSIYVTTAKDYWTIYLQSPQLVADQVNVLRLKSLRETVPGFPGTVRFGWGQRFMGLDQLPDELTGKGAKVAIIDSGADNTHPLLRHLQRGIDLTNGSDPRSWATDVVGHGSHCAGVITARGTADLALRGFAPEAEVHVLKLFPGGRFSSLLDALDYCIEHQIDVVNMSLGSDDASEAIAQKIEEATLQGVACVVAAGNSAGAVQFPATCPSALAVAAIGHTGEYPAGSWDSATLENSPVTPDGLFSPSFTCFGPEVALCAPGVAVISTVPDTGFEPESGTSMAAPHVTGLAALLLAHHPLFKGPLAARNQQRVAGLFQLLRSSAVPYDLGAGRTGAGVPKLLPQLIQAMRPTMVAMPGIGVAAGAVATPAAAAAAAASSSLQALLGLDLARAFLAWLGALQAPQGQAGSPPLGMAPQPQRG